MKKVIIAALALMLFSEGTYAAIAHAESKSTICITTKSNVDMPAVTGMQQPKKHHSKKHHSKKHHSKKHDSKKSHHKKK